MISIREERDHDRQGVYTVEVAAFDSEEEAGFVEELRDGGYVLLSLVAEDGDQIVGHILLTRMKIVSGGVEHPAVSLGPLAITPAYQRQGLGGRMIAEATSRLRERGERVVILLGHPWYYPRHGFRPAREFGLHYQNDRDAFMALELVPGALDDIEGDAILPPPLHDLPPPAG